ncbi:heparan-alpha-glucosaminide N-acetyltransferase domain-containing protein [Fodinicola acaciae]|uniref:heparan-alpha-glucosaminide N-acetyltransferase domain-containing protein n=1 Tax=Fodinicola acaciae TaxID=2681555 RepID=UPI0013D21F3B|nr:heparan-alpha-glucosaminide N-acetyltransferase domain-containing protein [Fodinicola acaciae]
MTDLPVRKTTTSVAAKAQRLIAVDATRGVALLGMMAVHSLYESNPDGSPTLSFAIFGGRAAATFAVLAGVGIAFMTGRKRVPLRSGPAVATGLLVRALVIGAIGLFMGYADARLAAVILPYYAVLFVLAIPLVFMPTWLVAVVGVAAAGGVPVLTHLWLPHLAVPSLDNPEFIDVIRHPVTILTELTITGEYPALSWLAYACAGIVVGRLSLQKIRVAVSLLGTGIVLAAGAAYASWVLLHQYGGLSQIWMAQPGSVWTAAETSEVLSLGADGTVPSSTWWWLAVDSPHTGTTPDMVGTIGAAMALLGAMLLLGHVGLGYLRPVIRVLMAPLAAAGGMTLTFYTAHIWFLNSDYDVYSAGVGYTLQVIAVLAIGLAWRATAGKGPLETLTSALSGRSRRWVADRLARPRKPRPAPVSPAVVPRPSDDATELIPLPVVDAATAQRFDPEMTMELPALRFVSAVATAEETTMEMPAIRSEYLLDIFDEKPKE